MAQGLGTAHRSVAADDDQRIHFLFADIVCRFFLRFFFQKFQAAGRAQHRTAAMNDSTDTAAVKWHDFMT